MKRSWTALAALAAGATALYLSNPEHGRQRRAALRRHVADAALESVETLTRPERAQARQARPALDEGADGAGSGRTLLPLVGGIALGAAALFLLDPRQRQLLQGRPPDDAVLVQRVRAALQRVLAQPQAVRVTADAGCVSLGGTVPAAELARLYGCVASVRGVCRVQDDGLEVAGPADAAPALHGLASPASAAAPPLQA